MLFAFLLLWVLVLDMNYTFGLRTKSDTKLSKGLKAMIIIPMAFLGYVLHPVLIGSVSNSNLISLIMMAVMASFTFVNLKLIDRLRS